LRETRGTNQIDEGKDRSQGAILTLRNPRVLLLVCLFILWGFGTVAIVWHSTRPAARCPLPGSALEFGESQKSVDLWDYEEADKVVFRRNGSVYTVEVPEAEGNYVYVLPDGIDVVFEVQTRIVTDIPSESAAVLAFESRDGATAVYLFADGHYSIERYRSGSWTTQAEGRYPIHDRQVLGTYMPIALATTWDETIIAVNGEVIATVPHPFVLQGSIGVGGVSSAPNGATVKYVHPVVTSLCDWDPEYGLAHATDVAIRKAGAFTLLLVWVGVAGWTLVNELPTRRRRESGARAKFALRLRDSILLSGIAIAGIVIQWPAEAKPLEATIGTMLVLIEMGFLWLLLRLRNTRPDWRRPVVGLIVLLPPAVALAIPPHVSAGLANTQGYWLLLLVAGLFVATIREFLRIAGRFPSPYNSPSFHFSAESEPVVGRLIFWEVAVPALWLLVVPLWATASMPAGPASLYVGVSTGYNTVDSFTMAAIAAMEIWAFSLLLWPGRRLPLWLRSVAFIPVGVLAYGWAVVGIFGFDLPDALILHGLWFGLLAVLGLASIVIRLSSHQRARKTRYEAMNIAEPAMSRREVLFAAIPIFAAALLLIALNACVPTTTLGAFIPGLPLLGLPYFLAALSIVVAGLVDRATRDRPDPKKPTVRSK
jgi:hypothetical protein